MPTPPYAIAQMSINGGGQVTGARTGNAGDTIQLSGQSTVGWTSQRWEIYDYPLTGFPAPGSWSTDSSGVYYSLAVTPPLITYPASPVWGKLAFRLRVNEALTSDKASSQLTDETAMYRVLSPVHALEDIAAGETTQYDSLRSWIGAYKRALVALEAFVAGGSGPTILAGSNLTNADQTLTVAGGYEYTLPASTLTTTRTKTLSTAGATETNIIGIIRNDVTANTMPIVNGGSLAGTIFTFPISTKMVAWFYYNGSQWTCIGSQGIS